VNGQLLALFTAGSTGGGQPTEIIRDNTDAATHYSGDWPSSTAVTGYVGANYQTHAPNGTPPGAITVDNTGSGFSVTGTWPTSTAVAGFEGANYRSPAANGAPPGALVIDNGSSGFTVTGTWPTSTAVTGYEGAHYQTHAAGSGSAVATWIPALAAAGEYQLYAKWTQHANRASNATYTIHHANGSSAIAVNQQQNGGQWNLLGTFSFTPGANQRIELSDQANGYVIADAIELVPVGALPNTATWQVTIPTPGDYRAYAKWTAHSNRATNATYRVHHAAGSTPVTVSQQISGAQWNLLGTYSFSAGSGQRIELTDQADGYVVADAVQLVAVNSPGNQVTWPLDVPPGHYEVYARWTAHANRATNAVYTVHHQSGATPVTVNQQQNGGSWQLLGTFDLTPSSTVTLTDTANGYVVADAIRVMGTGGSTPTAPGLSYVHTDRLGTPQVLTDANQAITWQADYQPFGKVAITTAQVQNNVRFPGQYFDEETGLHYNYFRDYDPTIGRYIQSDPIGLDGGMNTYTYALNQPTRYTDAQGLFVPLVIPGICAAGGCEAVAAAIGLSAWMSTPAGQKAAVAAASAIGEACSNDDDDCEREWEDARDYCDQVAAENGFGTGWNVTGRNYQQCVMGQVSERCGGNRVEYAPPPRKRRFFP